MFEPVLCFFSSNNQILNVKEYCMIICNIHGIYYIVFFNHSLPTISQQPFLKDSHPRLDFCFTLKEHDAQGRTTKWRSHFIVANRCYLLLLFGGDCGDDHCKSSCHVKVTRQENLRQLTWGECWLGQWILDFWMKVHHFFFFCRWYEFYPYLTTQCPSDVISFPEWCNSIREKYESYMS